MTFARKVMRIKAKKEPLNGNNPGKELSEELRKLLGDTVVATCKRLLSPDRAYLDSQTVSRQSFVSTCEVLETVFFPMLVFGDEFFPTDAGRREKLNEVVYGGLSYVVDQAKKFTEEGNHLCPGDPYINDTGDRMRPTSIGWPYIEANAFLISTILHFLLNRRYFRNIPSELDTELLKETAGNAIEQILDQFIKEKGWSYSTNDIPVEIYFTWSVVETLVEVLEWNDKIELLRGPDTFERLKEQLSQVRGAMELILFQGQDSRHFIFAPQIIEHSPKQVYNALQAFIILGVLETSHYMEMAQTLISLVANSHLIANQVGYEVRYPLTHGRVGAANLEDRSILPLVVRSIATVFGEYGNKDFLEFTTKARLRDPWSYMVMGDRVQELKRNRTRRKLWGPDGSEYEIYYTERVVEALVSCFYYVNKPNKSIRSLKLPDVDKTKFKAFADGFKSLDSNART
jgi:hypothetical protein